MNPLSETSEFKVALDRDINAWADHRNGEKGLCDQAHPVCVLGIKDFREVMGWTHDFCGEQSIGDLMKGPGMEALLETLSETGGKVPAELLQLRCELTHDVATGLLRACLLH